MLELTAASPTQALLDTSMFPRPGHHYVVEKTASAHRYPHQNLARFACSKVSTSASVASCCCVHGRAQRSRGLRQLFLLVPVTRVPGAGGAPREILPVLWSSLLKCKFNWYADVYLKSKAALPLASRPRMRDEVGGNPVICNPVRRTRVPNLGSEFSRQVLE
eukprot:SAG31_NODE_16148_length_721_cov_0.918006_1_plen_162_part_00